MSLKVARLTLALVLGLLAPPLATQAQRPATVPLIGYLIRR